MIKEKVIDPSLRNEFRTCKFENCKFKTYDRHEMISHIEKKHFNDDKYKKVI